MSRLTALLLVAVSTSFLLMTGQAEAKDCPSNAARVGPVCVDKYEASVWETTDKASIKKIRDNTITLADLRAAGAVQRGISGNDYGPGCPPTGKGCVNLYAVSIAGVKPSAFMTWFQALAAARNSGKRLLSNAEWQAAALGTPDGSPCVVTGPAPQLTPMPVSSTWSATSGSLRRIGFHFPPETVPAGESSAVLRCAWRGRTLKAVVQASWFAAAVSATAKAPASLRSAGIGRHREDACRSDFGRLTRERQSAFMWTGALRQFRR